MINSLPNSEIKVFKIQSFGTGQKANYFFIPNPFSYNTYSRLEKLQAEP